MGKEDKECEPGTMKQEEGKLYVCNKKGKWESYKKDRTIEGGIRRIYDLPPKERKTFLSRS
ncbi:MAG: hypothetical protein JXQ30_08760 [Spirochaetes bacterium]|nr:hypothetical protein [Spirochaetota bacterium]